jgi:excisionase family DNA binding protein
MQKLLTTKEVAEAIGVSESSMRRWTNSGVIHTARTVGGHRRISLSEAIRFVRDSGATVVRPDLLGLPQLPIAADGNVLSGQTLEKRLYEALLAGDETAAKGCVTGLFLNGLSVASICDGAIHRAMQHVGELWRDEKRGILIEHRAMSICVDALGVLRQMVGDPPRDAPVAIGAAPEGDPYLLPSMMAGCVLAEAGYRDINFGPQTPLELLPTAAEENKATLVWLAVKSAPDHARLKKQIADLAARLAAMQINLVIGGSEIEALAIRSSKYLHTMKTMAELSAFARGAVNSSTPSECG